MKQTYFVRMVLTGALAVALTGCEAYVASESDDIEDIKVNTKGPTFSAVKNAFRMRRNSFEFGRVDKKKSDFYVFVAQAYQHYQITLESESGDADIAVFNSDKTSPETLIVGDFNYSGHDDTVKFTALENQDYYIQVIGYEDSTYRIDLDVIDDLALDPILDQDELYFTGSVDQELPEAQSITLTGTFSTLPIFSETLVFSDDATSWLAYQWKPPTPDGNPFENFQFNSLEFSITANLPAGYYQTTALIKLNDNDYRDTLPQYDRSALFKPVNINYFVADVNASSDIEHGVKQSFTFPITETPKRG